MKTRTLARWAGTLAVCAASTLAQAQITKDLVVHLTFDNDYTNSINNGISGTPVGNPTFGPGQIGSGAVAVTTKSDGSEFDYVTLGQPALLNFGSVRDGTAVDFTISFWCNYTNQVDDPPFISNKNWNSSGNRGWGIFTQGGGNFRVNVTDDTGTKQDTSSTPKVRDGKWHHIVVTFVRTGSANIYVDGVLAGTSSMAGVQGPIDTIDSTYAVNIGQDGTGGYTDGGSADMENVFMDDLGIWRRALSAGEVTAIYNAGLGGTNLDNVPAIVNPYVKSTSPGTGDTGVQPKATLSAVISDGLNAVASNSIQFVLNGTSVPVVIAKTNSNTTVSFTPTTLLPTGDNTLSIIFGNNATPQSFFTNRLSFKVAYYVTLTPDLKVNADKTKPGFIWNFFANPDATANSNDRTEAALAGLLVDTNGAPLPNLGEADNPGVALDSAPPPTSTNAPLHFEIATVINLNAFAFGTAGNFTPDDQMPGMPLSYDSDGIAAEIITYLDLPAGLITMGVNSDDGFKTTVGKVPQDQLSGIVAGARDSNGETLFYINVQQAGVYAFRTAYENGTGGAAIEWFSVNSDGTKVLLNDTANGGIPAYRAATTTTPAYVKYVSPQPVVRQSNQPFSAMQIVLGDASTTVNDSSIRLKLDGSEITPVKVRQGASVALAYTPTGVEFPADVHQAELLFTDSASTNYDLKWSFMNLKNVVLPAPKILETFDSYTPGATDPIVPTGWVQTNYTDTDTAGNDPNNLDSDYYKGWVVQSVDTLFRLKSRINNVAPNQFSNGVPVTVLGSGNMLYAESDVRGGNQVQFLWSKPYDLSGVTNAAIGFASFYEQNQDNIGAIEYSIDGGVTWLPVVYYLDFADSGGDIVLAADGTVDAVATMTRPNTDTASWTENGVQKGGKYGDGIAAPITQALGPYIAPRENDNPVEGKRFEIYRLAQAGGHSDVRLRFAQLGTGSWYFGVDNLGFYDVPSAPPGSGTQPTPTVLAVAKASAASIVVSWTGTGTLLQADSLAGPWTAAASQANPQTITIGAGAKFYRVSQ